MAEIDHIVVAAESLAAGAAWVEARLGAATVAGGRHDAMGTHNRLLGLGPGLYLEVIAPDPAAPPPGRQRWFRLDERAGQGPALCAWVARTADLDAALAAAPPGAGVATAFARGAFRWRFGLTPDGRLPFADVFPALIEWQGAHHPAEGLPDSGCRLTGLILSHPDPAALRRALPVADPRIAVRAGPPGLSARLATPSGEVLL